MPVDDWVPFDLTADGLDVGDLDLKWDTDTPEGKWTLETPEVKWKLEEVT